MSTLNSLRRFIRMLKRKLQDLTVCCSYQVSLLHEKAHSWKEFRRQYDIEEEIGRGGFGVVYKAVRLSDDAPVAVKFVQHKHVREWTMTCKQLIPSELCLLETCSDVGGCVKLVDWFANSKGFLIVMERPQHCMDLFDVINTYGALSEQLACSIFQQVVDTVCEMYAKHGLIHRDIKDENLIVNMDTGEVKLVDFGATTSAEKACKKEFQGTRSYCPPEYFRQLRYLPLEATSWSLGVLLYILVTGSLPFRNHVQTCLGRVRFPPNLSKECCSLIKSCLTTVVSARATLSQIRSHSWMQQPIRKYSETFQQVLERELGRTNARSPRGRTDEGFAEEECSMNNVVLTEDVRSRDNTVCGREVSEWSNAIMNRSESRYDNVSASSLAEYMSLVSVAPTVDDTTSMATTNNLYYSTNDIADEADDVLPSTMCEVVKSASAYSLCRPRKRSLLSFRSFDELEAVQELDAHDTAEMPAAMSTSVTSSTSGEETLREQTPNPPVARMSRHRPLKVQPTSLAIFEIKTAK